MKISTWRVDLTDDEADLAVRALRYAAARSDHTIAAHPSDPAVRFTGTLARDRCNALAAKIADVAGVTGA